MQRTVLHEAVDNANPILVKKILPFMTKRCIMLEQANNSKKTVLEIAMYYSQKSKDESERVNMSQIVKMINERLLYAD